MFTPEELRLIDDRLRAGVKPEDVARDLGISYFTLRNRLIQCGKRIKTSRYLEDLTVVPIGLEQEQEVAA